MIEAVWKNLCRLHSLFLSVPLSCIIYGLILISKVNSLSVFHTNYIFVDEQKPLLSPAVLHCPPSLFSPPSPPLPLLHHPTSSQTNKVKWNYVSVMQYKNAEELQFLL